MHKRLDKNDRIVVYFFQASGGDVHIFLNLWNKGRKNAKNPTDFRRFSHKTPVIVPKILC
ncbi:MAG: hypothetical protein L6V79_00465 [Clostridium sp.]|nr:MAG: hypothetical protein L6V79_00465 [Clostridium sp.]